MTFEKTLVAGLIISLCLALLGFSFWAFRTGWRTGGGFKEELLREIKTLLNASTLSLQVSRNREVATNEALEKVTACSEKMATDTQVAAQAAAVVAEKVDVLTAAAKSDSSVMH